MTKPTGGKQLPRAQSPESLGIDSRAIIAFLDDCEKHDIELHSFMLLRHGKVAAEGWWYPYNPDTPHTMFSFSKSVAGTAIGFAIDEGLVSLDTKVYDLFPEYAPKRKRRWQDALTVEHLLTMTSGKMGSIIFNTERVDWVQSFLRAPFTSQPGEKFEYVSENSFMLTAIIKKLTGLNATEYLTPRLYEPLGIAVPRWEKTVTGVEVGGWGLDLKTEDQAKLMQCYLDDGKYDGKQVIPAFWAKTAGEQHVKETPGLSPNHGAGYGYQFWRNALENSYRCDGMFSQFGIVLKDYDACFVTSGGEPIEQKALKAIFDLFEKAFNETPLPENPEALRRLREKLAGLHMPCLPENPRRERMEAAINDRLIKFRTGRRVSILGAPDNLISPRRSGHFNNVRLAFYADQVKMFWTEKYDENTIVAGLDGRYRVSEGRIAGATYRFASCAAWLEDGSLEVWIRPLEHAQVRKLNFVFSGREVKMKSSAEKGLYDLALFGIDFKGLKADDVFKSLAKVAATVLEPIVEPDLNGRFAEEVQVPAE